MNEREPGGGSPKGLIEHFFRHEYGRVVALLVRRVGLSELEAVEDAVQAALLAALDVWVIQGVPAAPSAWLYTVAYRRLLASVRDERTRRRILATAGAGSSASEDAPPPPPLRHEVQDDLLRMLFICCDERLSQPSQLILSLKVLCGFSIQEIAGCLFATKATIHKRLARARARLQGLDLVVDSPPLASLGARVGSVQSVIYLLFNEGYLSTRADHAIRSDLCAEALRLGHLLADHEVGAEPSTYALLALMHLHFARLAARQDPATGGLLLLEEQDRTRWDREHLGAGAEWLSRSAHGAKFSRFHAEAGVAAEHCFAPSFAETRWGEIAELYAMLERLHSSPIHTLNRAVAVSESQGPRAGLQVLKGVRPPDWLVRHHLWDAVLSDLHRRCGEYQRAALHRERALARAPSPAIRAVLERRLTMVVDGKQGVGP